MRIPTLIREHKLVTALTLVIATPILVFVVWTAIALNVSYSTGNRAGLLQKMSKRGWLCKSWEGEIQMNAMPGTMPEIFRFTTRSDSIAGELTKMIGQRVVVTYDQHKGVPGSCFGDTEYFVTDVKTGGAP